MSLTVAVRVPAEDRAELMRWTAVAVDAGRVGAAGADRVAGRSTGWARTRSWQRVGVSKPTVIAWKKRYAAEGIAGLEDRPKPGRPAQVDEVAVVLATLEPPPERLGVTHWSTPAAGRAAGDQRRRRWRKVWRKWGLQPWRRETFKFSTDPQLEAKVRDVVGLYLDPPEKAVVLCVDEKSQIQALDRTAPILPMRPGLPEKATHDYVRHGTTTLFAALEVATGKVTDACYPRHRHERVPALPQAGRQGLPAGASCTWSCDNYATHKHPDGPGLAGPATRGSRCTSPRPRARG